MGFFSPTIKGKDIKSISTKPIYVPYLTLSGHLLNEIGSSNIYCFEEEIVLFENNLLDRRKHISHINNDKLDNKV